MKPFAPMLMYIFSLFAAAAVASGCAKDTDSPAEQSAQEQEDAQSPEPHDSCILDAREYSGNATYYAADGSGACSFPKSPADLRVAALNPQDFAGSAACGACVEVDGPDGSVRVRIVDLCPGCEPGDIDLSAEAFAEIADPDAGRVPVTWRFAPCPADGPIRYHFKEGSNQWWTAVQVRNHRQPIATVEIKAGDEAYQQAERSAYNYFIVGDGGMGVGPYDFRVTDTLGQVLEDRDIPFSPDTWADGQAQFPVCDPALGAPQN